MKTSEDVIRVDPMPPKNGNDSVIGSVTSFIEI